MAALACDPERVTCGFIDSRVEFFKLLNEKLGASFFVVPVSLTDPGALQQCDVLILGLSSAEPGKDSQRDVLKQLLRNPSAPPIVAFTASSERGLRRELLAHGAYDVFSETESIQELSIVLRRAAQFGEAIKELACLKAPTQLLNSFAAMLGTHPGFHAVLQLASKVADTSVTVLIRGESGTGKELLARAIHAGASKSNRPFVAVACSSLPESLIESELFGHERGAFTGAQTLRKGRFECAEDGTIFLDEIGELSLSVQVKLLRVLQERTFERLGSNVPQPMKARVICATNQDLMQLVKAGKFRLDLYYRINPVQITLPPLRERREDIPMLAYAFVRRFAQQHNRTSIRIASSALTALCEYDWPGNVRELQNVIEGAVVINDGPEIGLRHLPPHFNGYDVEIHDDFDEEVRSFKRRLLYRRLEECDNNKVRTAKSLGIARSSLHRLIEELHMQAPERKVRDGLQSVPSRSH